MGKATSPRSPAASDRPRSSTTAVPASAGSPTPSSFRSTGGMGLQAMRPVSLDE